MKILYYDCFSGISGDMNLGALIDLGVDKQYLINELSKLKISGYEIQISEDNRKGITGTKVTVSLENEKHIHHDEEAHFKYEHINEDHSVSDGHHNHYDHSLHVNHHDIHHEDNHEHHEHSHGSHSQEKSEHVHRNLFDIENIINNSDLSEAVKSLSKKIFLKVAEAEAKIHGKPLNEVHFHEVGAVDSIVDIIGASICLDYLKVDKVMASPVELGGGFVKCAHGIFPVPAPATTEILKGIPVKLGAVNVETTTPTGAAILAATVDEFSDKKEFTINKIAYGIGHRDTIIPNVLRVYLGENSEGLNLKESADLTLEKDFEKAVMLECNIDDMNPELYEYTMERLLESGAMDVFLTPIIMKKGRPGIKLSVLCSEAIGEKLTNIVLNETTTLGVRKYMVEKAMLKREFSLVDTKYGPIKIKKSLLNGRTIKFKPEYEDCKKIAKEKNLPIGLIYDEVHKEISKN